MAGLKDLRRVAEGELGSLIVDPSGLSGDEVPEVADERFQTWEDMRDYYQRTGSAPQRGIADPGKVWVQSPDREWTQIDEEDFYRYGPPPGYTVRP